jgi:hypothetical protein
MLWNRKGVMWAFNGVMLEMRALEVYLVYMVGNSGVELITTSSWIDNDSVGQLLCNIGVK